LKDCKVTELVSIRPLLFLVEDDADIARLIRLHLEQAGYAVREFFTAVDVLREAEETPPLLFLLDIMLPGGDGFDLCRRIRRSAQLSATAVIFLTARTSEADRVFGLELGADDYITKPFSPRELVARVKAVLRRFDSPLAPCVTRVADLEIDSGAMMVSVRARPVPVTATEFRLLDYLVRHSGRVFSRDQLLDAVWRETQYVTPRSVDVYIRRLREKIEPDADNPRYIKTVRGTGYRFEVPKADTLHV
jgi:DNA-binding response OmpR family regulator